jgi:hypothetical protein
VEVYAQPAGEHNEMNHQQEQPSPAARLGIEKIVACQLNTSAW